MPSLSARADKLQRVLVRCAWPAVACPGLVSRQPTVTVATVPGPAGCLKLTSDNATPVHRTGAEPVRLAPGDETRGLTMIRYGVNFPANSAGRLTRYRIMSLATHDRRGLHPEGAIAPPKGQRSSSFGLRHERTASDARGPAPARADRPRHGPAPTRADRLRPARKASDTRGKPPARADRLPTRTGPDTSGPPPTRADRRLRRPRTGPTRADRP